MALPTSIRTLIAAGVAGMAPPTYHFAYPPVDVRDPALWPAAAPQVFLEEGGFEPVSGPGVVGKWTNRTALALRAVVPAGAGPIDAELDLVDEDLKRMMHTLLEPLRAAGAYIVLYQGSVRQYRLVRARPGQVSTRFSLTWRQSRENPSST